MSNVPHHIPPPHQLQRRLVLSNRDLLAALDAEMRHQNCLDGWLAVRNRARALLRETPERGEP